jgi:hypothetical protein
VWFLSDGSDGITQLIRLTGGIAMAFVSANNFRWDLHRESGTKESCFS